MTETKNDTTKTEGDPVSVQSVAELYEVVTFLKNTGKAGMALAEEAKELAERERRISTRAKALQSKADHLAERETMLHRKENDLAEADRSPQFQGIRKSLVFGTDGLTVAPPAEPDPYLD